jgi:RimJ/RimL family protein N-acetyltransferase
MVAINTDPEVTRHLNRPVDAAAVDACYGAVTDHWQAFGYGAWVVEAQDSPGLLGFAGLMRVPPFLADAGAGVGPELGWRFASAAWGRGIATEAAIAARDDAFARLGLPEVNSIIQPDRKPGALPS